MQSVWNNILKVLLLALNLVSFITGQVERTQERKRKQEEFENAKKAAALEDKQKADSAVLAAAGNPELADKLRSEITIGADSGADKPS